MDTPLLLGFWHTLHAVHTRFVFEATVRARPFYFDDDLFESSRVAAVGRNELHLPAMSLGVECVGAQKLGTE